MECAAGESAAAISSLSMALGERLSGWVGATSQPMVGADAMLDLFDVPGAALQDAVSAPVHNPDESRMVITLYSANGASLSHVHLRLLEQVARLVTAAPPWRSRSESARRRRAGASTGSCLAHRSRRAVMSPVPRRLQSEVNVVAPQAAQDVTGSASA